MTNTRNQSKKVSADQNLRTLPKYVLTLIKAARDVVAHSHIDLEANEYHVDVLAMANLCGAIGQRKVEAAQ
jgi:hypothetical protein